jgi:spore maturation protein CgeB
VDEEIFHPMRQRPDLQVVGDIHCFDVAFLGLLYPKRQVFLKALAKHKIPPIRHGMCQIIDLHGYHREESIRLLASNQRQIKVFFNLPSMSRLLVSKVVEVLATGTFLLTPMLPEGAKKNELLFESGVHLVYYSPSNLGYVAQLLRDWASPEKDAERQKISEAGCREVHAKHLLSHRLAEILAKVGVKEVLQ